MYGMGALPRVSSGLAADSKIYTHSHKRPQNPVIASCSSSIIIIIISSMGSAPTVIHHNSDQIFNFALQRNMTPLTRNSAMIPVAMQITL